MKAAKSFLTAMRGNTQVTPGKPTTGNKHAFDTVGTGTQPNMPIRFKRTPQLSPIGGLFKTSNQKSYPANIDRSKFGSGLPKSGTPSGAVTKRTPRKLPW